MPPIIPYGNEIPPPEGVENCPSNQPPANLMSDSDSLSEDEDHEGYEPLSQDPDNYIGNSSDLEEDSNFLSDEGNMVSEVDLINHSLLLPAMSAEPDALIQPTETRQDLKLDQEKIDTIKSVMKSIKLPQSNLPQWATVVPEEEWKSRLLSEMIAKQKGELKSTTVATPAQSDFDCPNDIPR